MTIPALMVILYFVGAILTARLVVPLYTQRWVGPTWFAAWMWPVFLICAFAARNDKTVRAPTPEDRVEADYQETLALIEWRAKPRTTADDIADALEMERDT